ncbi:CPBP family intramembrane glutamic endopeptidase [Aerosticca soli]|jgi:membrane protease YdiL (CAAX protease family)|uniref:CPBP family intramembrane glutamic endopeptidase n=1 Tax=Aerosticca soli TaxID=2010829 RepID=UPI000F83F0E2|nr:CPBP family intramembrane glutamic endopeptidase [Aerosticca soli]
MLFDTLVTMGGLQLNAVLGLSYNWLGKGACSIAAVLFVTFGPLQRAEVGFCMPIRWRGAYLWVLLGLMVFAVMFAPDLQVGAESFGYQLTMPGIAEELTYRGILLALLLRIYGNDARAMWLAALVTSVAFACIHDLDFHGKRIICPPGPFAFHFAMGMFFAWIRLSTGSLLMPILAHNLYNTAAEMGGLWRLAAGQVAARAASARAVWAVSARPITPVPRGWPSNDRPSARVEVTDYGITGGT